MAVRYAVASGLWSDPATWDGGTTLPTAGDTVHADGWTVTIDQSINVGSLRTTARSGGTAGGKFIVSAGGHSLTLTESTPILPGTTTAVETTHATGTTTINAPNGEIYNASGDNATGCVNVNGAGTVDVFASLRSGSQNRPAVFVSASGATLRITGNVSAIGTSQNGAVRADASCTVSITGNVMDGNRTVLVFPTGNVSLTIIGNVEGQAVTTNSPTISWSAAGTIDIIGNVMGGTAANNHGINLNASGPTVTITGTVSGSSGGAGLWGTGNPTVTINGAVHGGSGWPGAGASGASATFIVNGDVHANVAAGISAVSGSVRIAGSLFNHEASGGSALVAARIIGDWSTPARWRFKAQSGGTVDLVTTDSLSGLPSEADVRDGVVYGATGEFTGTLTVPDPSNVRRGVPTDDTVGTADLTAADLWAFPTADATVPGSMGERLRNAATPDTTGAQLVAFG